jgi:hypothetical protein
MITDLLVEPSPQDLGQVRSRLAAELPAPLPDSFTRWLAIHGGSSVRPPIRMPDDGGSAELASFFTAGEIVSNYRGLSGGVSEVIPLEFVLVGQGRGGGVCLNLSPADYGSVWFADFALAVRILPDDDTRSPDIMFRLFDDWDAFLAFR